MVRILCSTLVASLTLILGGAAAPATAQQGFTVHRLYSWASGRGWRRAFRAPRVVSRRAIEGRVRPARRGYADGSLQPTQGSRFAAPPFGRRRQRSARWCQR